MSYIDLTNFVSVSVSSPATGLAQYQRNNLALFTKEVPVNGAITQAAPGVYASATQVGTDWGITSEAYAMAVLIFSQSPNILDGSGLLIIYPMAGGDTLSGAIAALFPALFFGGAIWGGYAPNDAEVLAAVATCETNRIELGVSSYLTSTLTPVTGLFAEIQANSQRHGRCLLYTQGASAGNARKFAAAYMGRALSVDFGGTNTTSSMHGKTLVGLAPDTGITQAILNSCITIGADTYPSVGGGGQYVGKVFSTGGNDYFDNVYNLDWLVSAVQVAGFNAITGVSTKIPQTEKGMNQLKSAYNVVLQQALANGYIAPGSWNSPELFGSPQDLLRCILNTGYYMYSQPVNQQAQSNRLARKAPPVQIAIKLAGAIHSSNVIVSVNP